MAPNHQCKMAPAWTSGRKRRIGTFGAFDDSRGPAVYLALNGALLVLAGLFVGAAIPAVPYPRLMLAAHSAGFNASGLSMVAGPSLSSSPCKLPPRAAGVVIWGHVAPWPLSLSEVAAASWERPGPSGSPAPKPVPPAVPDGRKPS